jgi:hypothetical protein
MRAVRARGRRRILGVFVTAVLLGGAAITVAVANPASAAADHCPPGNFCMYMKKHFAGGPITHTEVRTINVGATLGVAPEAANRISGVVNNSGRGITLFDHRGGRGNAFHVRPWTRYPTLGNFNNKTESVVF